jgi:hypothetical protein
MERRDFKVLIRELRGCMSDEARGCEAVCAHVV